ncbi:hypothetical protein PISMIDRAFT_19106 [Pisolithus microcarpus 441]|uniref:Uncharacterized protein n=1 Tax=Pisolithus microcarpus 441 TaxID=765257 RepID=A0A0C9YDR0_9AGAM|nr:hypothetical protein PISMIDRAFT_19106 [Pisolithus microcarpus 441]
MSDHLWPIEVIVHVTKEVIEDRVGYSPPHLVSKKPSSGLESPKEPAQHSHSPSIGYWPDSPVEHSRSRSRRGSQGSSSSKSPSHSPFEAAPRTSKNTPHPSELASSSSTPHRVTIAGSRHPVVHPPRERIDSHTHTHNPRDLGSTSTRPPRPHEPSNAPSKCYSCFEMSSKSFGKAYPRLESPLWTPSKPPSDCEPPQTTSFLLREAPTSTVKPSPTTLEVHSRVSNRVSPLRDLEGMLSVSFVVEKDMFGRSAKSAVREEIPREALGHTLQARLDFWALACGPGGAAVQVKSPPSSSKSSPPLVCPRGDLETTPEPLSSSRAPTSPSRVSLSPSSTSETLDRKLRSFEASPSQMPRFVTASQRLVSPSQAPLSPSSRLPRPVWARGQPHLQSHSLIPP